MDPALDVTRILKRLGDGDDRAGEDLVPILYDELHRIASRTLEGQRSDHTLQSTALLNEAWIRLVGSEDVEWVNRAHFLGVAAKAMRSVLVDHARRRGAAKRAPQNGRLALEEVASAFESKALDLLSLDEALEELAAVAPDRARIVELRFFGGLSHPEIARLTGAPLRSVERDWRAARAWLHQRVVGD